MITFRLHRGAVIALAIASLLLGVLLFAGGYVAAMLRYASPVTRPAIPSSSLLTPVAPTTTAPAIQNLVPRADPFAATSTLAPVAPIPAPTPPSTTAAPAPPVAPSTITLRFGVFGSEDEAKGSVADLATHGVRATIVVIHASEGALLYTTQGGEYSTRSAAVDAASQLERKGLHAVVVASGTT
jgi:cell division protein FtsN